MRHSVVVIAIAGLAALCLASGCAGSKRTEDPSNNYSYLDDKALEKLDGDLNLLRQAIDRADDNSEKSIRRSISEQARRYQVALISALSDYSSTPRRRIAGVALGFTGDVTVIGPLLDKINDGGEPESVRINAVLGLATLGGKLRDYPRHDQLMNTLRNVMENRDTSASMRRSAVAAYAAAFDKVLNDSVAPLADRLLGDSDLGVQVAAINALGDIGDAAAAPDLIHALTLPSDELRIAAAIALGRVPDTNREVVPALIEASDSDESDEVRREAISSLVFHYRSDPDTVFGAIMFGLTDLDDDVRESATLALAQTTDERAVDALIQATGDRAAMVRLAAADSLPLLVPKEKESLAYPLVDLLSDQNPMVSRAAQSSLVKITGKNMGDNQGQWRTFFYKTYPQLDPANAYVGKPKPRMTSNLQGSGSRSTGTRTTSRPGSTSRPSSSSSNRPTQSGTRTGTSGRTGGTGRTGR